MTWWALMSISCALLWTDDPQDETHQVATGTIDSATKLVPRVQLSFALADVSMEIEGADSAHDAGRWVNCEGDVTGDGIGDVILTATKAPTEDGRGIVYIVPGPIDSDRTVLDAATQLTAPLSFSGWDGGDIAVGDIDDDGLNDMVISGPDYAPDGGREVYVVHGPPEPGVTRLASADAILRHVDPLDQTARTVAVGDLDGKGGSDVFVGAPERDGPGEVYRVAGPISKVSALESATTVWRGEATPIGPGAGLFAGAGAALVVARGLSGTDAPEIVIGAPSLALAGDSAPRGAVYVSTQRTGAVELDAVDAQIIGEESDAMGEQVAVGDFDGDGQQDLVVSVNGKDALYAIRGPLSGRHQVSTLGPVLITGLSDFALGSFDLDGDGADELVAIGTSFQSGRVYMVGGLFTGGSQARISELATVVLDENPSRGGQFSADVSVGEVTGDGVPDLCFGFPENFQQASPGRVYVVDGALLRGAIEASP